MPLPRGESRDTGEFYLLAHFKLSGDCLDHSGNGLHGTPQGVEFGPAGWRGNPRPCAHFNGRDARILVNSSDRLALGKGEVSLSLWVHTDNDLDDALGDLVSKYHPESRTGFSFGFQHQAGVASAQPNYRNLHFGIDCAHLAQQWTDCGRPGSNRKVYALAVYQGRLYAGTFEGGDGATGGVYRFVEGNEWESCGSPDPSNSVTSLAVFDGRLYAGVAHYRARGSALPESPNLHPGGRVYRFEGDGNWLDCGRLGGPGSTSARASYDDWVKGLPGWSPDDVDSVHGLAVFNGHLYAIPLYHQGVYRYDGGDTWTDCGGPGCRLLSLGVHGGALYAAGNEGGGRGGVYRYQGGTEWSFAGNQQGVNQSYSFAAYADRLFLGTYPEGKVFRDDGNVEWTDCGRLGEELEVMGMTVYNGKLYAGTLPLAEVYRYDGDANWKLVGRLDFTPEVRYRRAWTMAVFQGKLFCGTLPSGHVHCLEAGKNVTYDHELAPGWRHIVAVRGSEQLQLYVDGSLVASSPTFRLGGYDISNDKPLLIGAGPTKSFKGRIADVRVYDRAISPAEVLDLSVQ